MKLLFTLIGLSISLGACLASAQAVELGFSGMTQMDDSHYLVVLDKKVFHKGERVGVLKIGKKGKQSFKTVQVADWRDADGQASDLESVCKLPNTENEYLLAESGYWQGKFGRIFHVSLHKRQAEVLHVYHLPDFYSNAKGVDGDNFEGMECSARGDSTLIILGERGGSERYPDGYLRFGVLNADKSALDWHSYAHQALVIKAPGVWRDAKAKRSISDLYLDKQGTLWAVATEDAGDMGPFTSVIYAAAQLAPQDKLAADQAPVRVISPRQVEWRVDGFKVEALAAPTSRIAASRIAIGTEDEDFGGVWRALFAPVLAQ